MYRLEVMFIQEAGRRENVDIPPDKLQDPARVYGRGRDPEHQQVSLTFQVNSGKRARFTAPAVKGETRIPAADLAKSTKYKGWFRWKQVRSADRSG